MSERLSKKFLIFVSVTLVGLVIDQITKYWIRNTESIAHRIRDDGTHLGCDGFPVISGFFDIVHRENPGAAFGMLSNLPENWRLLIFLGFTVIALFVILDMFRKLPSNEAYISTTLGLVLSGALGNAIDRIHQVTVTDFLRFYTNRGTWLYEQLDAWVGMTEYPSFNVADAALVVGVGMFVVHYLFLEENEDEDDSSDAVTSEDEASAEKTAE